MKHAHIRTFITFLGWGGFYGLILGGLAGTIIYPIVGTMYSAFWGIGMGLALGAVLGISISVYNHNALSPETDLTRYRQRLAITVGMFTAAGAVAILVATSHGFLWTSSPSLSSRDSYSSGGFLNSPLLIACMLSAFFWGGLSSAHVASRYADNYFTFLLKKNGIHMDKDLMATLPEGVNFVSLTLSASLKIHWFYAFTGISGAAAGVLSANTYRTVDFITYPVYAVLGGVLFSAILALVVGFEMTFVYRLYVQEYSPNLTGQSYLARFTVLLCAIMPIPLVNFYYVGVSISWLWAVACGLCGMMGYALAMHVLSELTAEKAKKRNADADDLYHESPVL